MQNIAQYMRHKRVPGVLAQKITSFYEYQLSPHRSGEGQHELIDLPPLLAMELIMHTHRELFRDCPIFSLVPPPTALTLVECFESVVFVPTEIVIHEGKTNRALYVINRGLVKVWRHDETLPDKRKDLTTLTDSDFFGEQTLLKTMTSKNASEASDSKANATCQCAAYCDMFRLTSDDFMAVLEDAQSRNVSLEGKDVAGILSDAADVRNLRATETKRKPSTMLWNAAREAAICESRKQKSGRTGAGMRNSGALASRQGDARASFCSRRAGSRRQARSPTIRDHNEENAGGTLARVVKSAGAVQRRTQQQEVKHETCATDPNLNA